MEKILFGFAKQWIAGDSINDALKSSRTSYKNGRHAIVNKLGEYHTSKTQIKKTVKEYQKIVLSHIFVWIDMESSDHTDETIEIYYDLFARYERLGIAIQANLKRTKNDLMDLLAHGAKIRLVKGAYKENSRIAFQSKEKVDANYVRLMKLLFKNGNEFGIATHDSKMIDLAIKLSKKYKRKFEFQMLRGIREELKPILVKQRFVVSDYIPYGTNWLPYSIRRLKERKRNILLLGSSFIQSHRV